MCGVCVACVVGNPGLNPGSPGPNPGVLCGRYICEVTPVQSLVTLPLPLAILAPSPVRVWVCVWRVWWVVLALTLVTLA